MGSCPVCGVRDHEPVVRLEGVPALCNALWPSAEQARAAAAGDVDLVTCCRCGLLFNRSFDPELVAYSPAYENSLQFSPTFRRYADELARRLVDRYDLRGTRIVEIGSGSGAFLERLCALGGNQGTGFDPSHDPGRADVAGRVRIVAAPFPTDEPVVADLVTGQHVLEHIPAPRALLDTVRRMLRPARPGREPVVYLEVPDAGYMLEQAAVWDVIYEHCTYFTAATLGLLLGSTGFRTLDTGAAFGGQYLWVEVAPGPAAGEQPALDEEAREALLGLAAHFGRRYRAAAGSWTDRVRRMAGDGPVAVWGAGSKGVAFLNTVDPEHHVGAVVDINPRKHGLHVPGTGHRVGSPDELTSQAPAHVLLMNGIYAPEVEAMLAERGLDAARLTVVEDGAAA